MNPTDFHSLSVRDKIRELRIQAHEARTKAGPMFRNTSRGSKIGGKHLTPEEMPDTWRRWNTEAERLEGEVKRLREIVRTPYQQAAE